MSITITTTITVRPPNVVPICPTSTSTQLLVHPHGGVFPRIIDLEHWKNHLGLKCAIIHYLLWGTQLRQTWVTRVSQSHSSQKKKTQLVFGKYLSFRGLLLRSIPILISGIRPTESIACGKCQWSFCWKLFGHFSIRLSFFMRFHQSFHRFVAYSKLVFHHLHWCCTASDRYVRPT